MANNQLTFVICCYNSGKFLRQCLDSLVKQKSASLAYKVLFIDDASTDDSLNIAADYLTRLKPLTIISNKKNAGLVICCNKALSLLDTPHLMRLDADDYLAPDAIAKITKELKAADKKDFIVFARRDLDNAGYKQVRVTDDIYGWIAVATIFDVKALKSVGGYSNTYWEEYDLYIRLLEKGSKFKVSPEVIYYYRRGHGSMTSEPKDRQEGCQALIDQWGLKTLNKYGNFKAFLKYCREN